MAQAVERAHACQCAQSRGTWNFSPHREKNQQNETKQANTQKGQGLVPNAACLGVGGRRGRNGHQESGGRSRTGGTGGKSCRRVRETRVNKQNSRKRTTAPFCRLSRCGAQILTGGFSLLDPGASASSFRNRCVMATWCHKTDFTCCPHPSPNDRQGRARARELFLTILTYFSSRRVTSQTPPV